MIGRGNNHSGEYLSLEIICLTLKTYSELVLNTGIKCEKSARLIHFMRIWRYSIPSKIHYSIQMKIHYSIQMKKYIYYITVIYHLANYCFWFQPSTFHNYNYNNSAKFEYLMSNAAQLRVWEFYWCLSLRKDCFS